MKRLIIKKTTLQSFLFRFILVLLFLPMLQQYSKIVSVKGLGGYSPPKPIHKLTQSNWLDGSYQKNKEIQLKEKFGFRSWLVRAERQWDFSAYGIHHAMETIIGKENYLYQIACINNRNGIDFVGEEKLGKLARKLKKVQDTLKAANKTFLFITAPSKAAYFPEYIPDQFNLADENTVTNHAVFREKMAKHGINHLDLNSWLISQKDTSRYPLYPRTGIHYSSYGGTISAQKIIAQLEQQLQKDLPEMNIEKVTWSSNRYSDDNYDLERALNLIYSLSNDNLAYPEIKIDTAKKHRPKVICIGDSFYMQLTRLGLADKVFDNGQFWYYIRDVFPGKRILIHLDFEKEFEQAEVVMIMMTPHHMKDFLHRFVDHLYNFYFNKKHFLKPEIEELINKQIKQIKNNPKWFASIKKKALKRDIPLKKMLYLDAQYVINQEKNKQKKQK